MKELLPLALAICLAGVVSARGTVAFEEQNDDLKPESSKRRIYDIIQSHEGRKYGDHGGHEYEAGEIPLASRKRYGYLPVPDAIKSPLYYEVAPQKLHIPKDQVYRENVAAYAAKANVPQQVIASPVSHSHYAIVDPKTHNQYIVYDEPKPHYNHPVPVDHKPPATYILEEEPHYVVPNNKIVVKPPVVSHSPQYHYPVKDYKDYGQHHVEDKRHHASGHGHHGDNSVHGESSHKAHKAYEVAGHKEHSSKAGHHGEHDHHHNRVHYERDRGYHYEKAYAYDRVRAHHDIGHDKGSHSNHNAQHAVEGHKDIGNSGSNSYQYFKKNDQHGGYGHHDKNSLYKKGNHGGQGYHEYGIKYHPLHQIYKK